MEGFPNEMERAFLFSGVFHYPIPGLGALHRCSQHNRFWRFFPGKVVSGPLATPPAFKQGAGHKYRVARVVPIVVACAIWHPFFVGKRLQFWCDNESVVSIINSGHSKAPRIMDLVRFLVLISMKHNSLVRARHVPGVSNEIADALSRFQMQRFQALAPTADRSPCTIPPSLMTL